MTPERAREVIRAQSQFPYWGNYQKFMTNDEVAHCQDKFMKDPNGNVTFAMVVQRVAREDMPYDARPMFDERDAEIVRERLRAWDRRPGPRVGDFIFLRDGTLRRFTHHWGDGLQTTGKGEFAGDASFHFHPDHMSFSGSLDPAIPLTEIEPMGETRDGRAWIFHHDQTGAHRGVHFTVPCRVFRQKVQS